MDSFGERVWIVLVNFLIYIFFIDIFQRHVETSNGSIGLVEKCILELGLN